MGVDITKQFSPGRVAVEGVKYGLKVGLAMNRTTGRYLEREEDQKACWDHIRNHEPWIEIGSPPCTPFLESAKYQLEPIAGKKEQ